MSNKKEEMKLLITTWDACQPLCNAKKQFIFNQ